MEYLLSTQRYFFVYHFFFGTFVFPSIIIFSVGSFDSDFFNSINLPSLTLFFFSLCDIKARRRIATLTLSKQKAYNENPYKLPFDFYTHFKFGSIILIVHLNLWFIVSLMNKYFWIVVCGDCWCVHIGLLKRMFFFCLFNW